MNFFFVYFFSIISNNCFFFKTENYWKELNNRKKFFIEFARKRRFDPFRKSNWENISLNKIIAHKVWKKKMQRTKEREWAREREREKKYKKKKWYCKQIVILLFHFAGEFNCTFSKLVSIYGTHIFRISTQKSKKNLI